MNRLRSFWLGIIVILVLIVIGVAGQKGRTPSVSSSLSLSPQAALSPSPFATIEYEGVDGKTVFDLLRQSHQVDSQQYDYGVLVKSIDGQASDTSKYWLYYINGKSGEVAADKYQTKTGDTIEWRLEAAQ